MADALWSNVAALLHFDGAIVDEKGHTVTVSAATVSTAAPIAGSGSLALNGGTVTIALDAPIASQDFSLEWLMRLDAAPADGTYWLFGPQVDGLSVAWYQDAGDLGLSVWADGVSIFDWILEPVVGEAMAMQITFASGTYYLLADGALLGTTSYPVTLPATSFIIGRAGASYSVWPGLIDEVRLTVGAVRNTDAYAPNYGVLESGAAAPVYVADGGAAAAVFRAKVLIDGIDQTDNVLGEIQIDREEGAAAVAELILQPPLGTPIYLPDWTGRPVVISIGDYSTGVLVNETIRFTGKVDLPTVDLDAKTLHLRCTDDYQGRVGSMSKTALASLIGGYYSPAVFDTGASAWGYANDRLSTVRARLDISPTGVFRLTPWAAKSTADLTFTDDDILDGSLSVDLTERSSMVNLIDLTFAYRFPRMKAEGYQCNFDALDPIGFEQYIIQDKYIPTRAQVVSAIEAAGGTIASITYDALPTTSVTLHGSGGAIVGTWIPNPATDPTLCTGWQAVVSFDYAQQIDETHEITLSCALSIDAIGEVAETMSGAMVAEYADTTSVETAATLYANNITGIPPMDKATVVAGYTNSTNVTLSADTDRAAAENAMQTLIAVGAARIAAAHRTNTVSATIPLHGAVDVNKTVAIATPKVTAKGKIKKVVDTIDIGNARATSEISLAISAIAGVGANHTADANVAPTGTSDGVTTALTAPVVVFNNATAGDHTITITFPGVESTERNNAAPVLTSTYAVAIPEDVFEVTL